MLPVALRGLVVRKLRATLTALAVFLGVALMAGTYVLTDTFNSSFEEIFEESAKGTDVAVVPEDVIDSQQGEPPAFEASLLERVRGVEGVQEAAGGIFSAGVTIFDDKRERVGVGGAPSFGASTLPKRFDPYEYEQGRPPRSDGEVAIDALTADKEGFEVGDRVLVGGESGARRYRLVGLARLGGVSSFGGATVAILTLPEAQRQTDKVGLLDQISVAAAGGTSPEALRDRVRRALPRTVSVRTGQENAERQSDDIAGDLGFLKTALLIFSGVALFVGAFTIFNTFSITVAQRTHEFGLLRTLGASRAQVLASVLGEALAIAAVASALGLLAGLGVAGLLNSLMKAVGIDLPNTGNVLRLRTVTVSLSIGLLVTFVAALVPGLRATRVTPMEALREATVPPGRARRRLSAVLASLLSAGGLALLLVGLFGDVGSSNAAAGLLGIGVVAIFLGVALLSPRLVRPLVSLLGRPLERLRGITGRLARENSLRNPGRTAVTAAALMIGLALVTFVTVFAAGIRSSVDDAIDRSFKGDFNFQHTDGFSPIPAAAGREASRIEGVAAVSGVRFSEAKTNGDRGFVTAVDPRHVNEVLDIDWEEGSNATLAALAPNEVVMDSNWGEDNDVDVGDRVEALTRRNRRVTYAVRGSLKDTADLYGNYVMRYDTMERDFGERRDALTIVKLGRGADEGAVRKRLEDLISQRFPVIEVFDQEELKDRQSEQINQLLGLLYALLSLAVIVSLFGIVNTLTLSIYERTRELGLLRAIGMSRAQVRRVVRYESVITALIGALMGSVLGVLFAVIVSRPLAEEGFGLSFPVPTLILLMILAALAGVVASILPARRASRLDVLEALAYE